MANDNQNTNGYEYEVDETLLMPLPLTAEELETVGNGMGNETTENLTEEQVQALTQQRFPQIQVPNVNVTVIPMLSGITAFGYIRFLNASPGRQRVDIYVNGQQVVSALSYQEFTEYQKVLPGSYRVAVFAAGTKGNPLAVSNIQVQSRQIYTVALIGLPGDTAIQVIEDPWRMLNDTVAYIRFVQLSPNAPTMNVYWDNRQVLSDLNYQDVSRYLQTTPGSHTLRLRAAASGASLVEHPSVDLDGGKAYTVYVVGDLTGRMGLQVLIPLEGASYLKF